jgi:hypothetical protein
MVGWRLIPERIGPLPIARSHPREQFDHPTWHCINHPIVPAGLAFRRTAPLLV